MKLLRNVLDVPYVALAATTVLIMSSTSAAQAQSTVGQIAGEVQEQVGAVGKLLVIALVLVGVVMVGAGLMKLKQAADTQGQQVKYGEGFWRLGVGAGLVGVPALTGVLTTSLGLDATAISAGSGF